MSSAKRPRLATCTAVMTITRVDTSASWPKASTLKAPQATAMKFVNYLQDKDLRNLMKSRDVPSVVSTHARRILTKKGKL